MTQIYAKNMIRETNLTYQTSTFGVRTKPTAFILQEKKRVHKRLLDVTTYYISRVRPHTPELLEASKAKLLAMAQRDKERMMLQEAKNKVESYIYKIKNKLQDDEEAVGAVSTEEQRQEVQKLAIDAGEWLDEDGYDADLKTMEAKFLELSVPFEKILLRLAETKARPQAVAALNKKLVEMEGLMKLWEETKQHITADERGIVIKQVEEMRKWIEEKEAEQALKLAHEDPVFVSADLPGKTRLVESLILSLDKKPAPKPKKKKKVKGNETDTNSTETDSDPSTNSTNTDTNETKSTTQEDDSNATEVPASGAEEEL